MFSIIGDTDTRATCSSLVALLGLRAGAKPSNLEYTKADAATFTDSNFGM